MAVTNVCARCGRYAAVCENASGSGDLAKASHLDESDIKAIARAHASVLVDVVSAAEASIMDRAATKQAVEHELNQIKISLERFEARVDLRFASVDARLAELKTDLFRWVVSVGILQTALIAALVLKLTS